MSLTDRQPSDRPPAGELAILGIALAYPSLLTWLYFMVLSHQPAVVQQSAYGIGKAVQFILPAIWIFWLHRQPRRLPLQAGPGVWVGLAFGGMVLLGSLAVYYGLLRQLAVMADVSLAIQQKLADLKFDYLQAYILLAVFYSLVHSLLEEYYWRWFVYGELRGHMPVAPALLLASLGFMAHHVLLLGVFFGFESGWTYLLAASVAVGGAFWALLYEWSRSLLGPWLSHLLVDAAIFVVGYDLVRPLLEAP